MTDSIATVNGIMLVTADLDPQVASAEEGLMFHALLTRAPFCPASELNSLRKKARRAFFSGLPFLCQFSKNLILIEFQECTTLLHLISSCCYIAFSYMWGCILNCMP